MSRTVVKAEEIRRVIYTVFEAEPLTSYGGPTIDPQHLILNIDVLGNSFRANVEGAVYKANGKVGTRLSYVFFNQATDAPQWVNEIVAAEGLSWPTHQEDNDE